MAIVFQKWDSLISTTLNPAKANLTSLTDEDIQVLINDSEEEQEIVRTLLIEELINNPKIRDKQAFVQINQALLIRLLDKIYLYKQTEGLPDTIKVLFDTISQNIENTLNFIEDFFSNYFDRNEKVPASYLAVSLDELCRQFEHLQLILKSKTNLESDLCNILINNFDRFCYKRVNGVTYNELLYQKDLMNELLTDETLSSATSIKEVLFYFNFNNDDFVAYIYHTLTAITDNCLTKAEKITSLRYEQKNINQLSIRLNSYLTPYMPSLNEQVNKWIEEEIKFLEVEQTIIKSDKTDQQSDEKIQTSLSVAKLALLIKLMLVDKIITNRIVANVLRIVIKNFTTLQKENVSFGSLETKYHNPDRGTISATKDMLFRWINILSKL